MKARYLWCVALVLGLCLIFTPQVMAQQKAPSLDAWKPKFDPSGAKYKAVVSNVSSPALKGVFAGFQFRDAIWEKSGGQIYIDYKPFSILGGEVEVLNQLQMGAIQGMSVSSVASTNLGPRMGIVNLPFLVNSFEKLDKFVGNKQLFDHFLNAMDHQGITGFDITAYGLYGWATTKPVKTLEDAKKVKFRIAEAAVNNLLYKEWGLTAVVMPWPDVPVALKQGVIDGLDHTATVCSITKKFEDAKYFTKVDYAMGLFIWIFNKKWFQSLPPDLQQTFTKTLNEVCAQSRKESVAQENEELEKIKKEGIEVFTLPEADMAILKEKGDAVHKKYADEINKLYPGDKYRPENYLKEVQVFMGYSK